MDELQKCHITKFEIIGDYTLSLNFADGTNQVVDLSKAIGKGWMAPLLNKDYFARVELKEGGVLEWPDGQDFDPEALYHWPERRKFYES